MPENRRFFSGCVCRASALWRCVRIAALHPNELLSLQSRAADLQQDDIRRWSCPALLALAGGPPGWVWPSASSADHVAVEQPGHVYLPSRLHPSPVCCLDISMKTEVPAGLERASKGTLPFCLLRHAADGYMGVRGAASSQGLWVGPGTWR